MLDQKKVDSLYDRAHFWICPRCDFHFNKKTFGYETFKQHLNKCAVEEVKLLQLCAHPEVSDEDEEVVEEDREAFIIASGIEQGVTLPSGIEINSD